LLSWTFGSNALAPTADAKPTLVPNIPPKKKSSMLPVLVVLFVICYSMMTMLIVEQGRTIESQRSLIHQLFSDSTELSHLKASTNIQKQRANAQAQAEAQSHSQVQNPSTQEKKDKAEGTSKLQKPVPPKYPKEGTALDDVRRVLVSI